MEAQKDYKRAWPRIRMVDGKATWDLGFLQPLDDPRCVVSVNRYGVMSCCVALYRVCTMPMCLSACLKLITCRLPRSVVPSFFYKGLEIVQYSITDRLAQAAVMVALAAATAAAFGAVAQVSACTCCAADNARTPAVCDD